MSYLHPESPDAYDNPSEYEVARELASSLPENWHVISNVEWAKETRIGKRTGEIDFVVLAPGNLVHVIELTMGTLEFDASGELVVTTHAKKKNKTGQLKSNKTFVIELLREARHLNSDLPTHTIYSWLLAPQTFLDNTIPNPLYAINQVVDGRAESPSAELCRRMLTLSTVKTPLVHQATLRIFLRALRYYLDPSTLIEGERRYVSGLSQATDIVLSIKSNSNRIVIDGVAGSGKTQIALAGLEDTLSKNRKAALVSNTRVLPNLIQSEYGNTFPAHTYWTIQSESDQSLDELFIEEAHHFQPAALQLIEQKIKPDGRIFYLMDSCQNFDDRFVYPENCTKITLNTTYRVPHEICSYLNLLKPLAREIRCKSPQLESHISIDDSCTTDSESFERALHSFLNFLQTKIDLAKFCSVVYCGSQQDLEHVIDKNKNLYQLLLDASRLTGDSHISGAQAQDIKYYLKRHTIDYEKTRNTFTIDTIRRFQGSSNKFIWVTGLDTQSTDTAAARLFYSAVTRSRARCEVFCTQGFAYQVAQGIQG